MTVIDDEKSLKINADTERVNYLRTEGERRRLDAVKSDHNSVFDRPRVEFILSKCKSSEQLTYSSINLSTDANRTFLLIVYHSISYANHCRLYDHLYRRREDK
jgi:hypothetical protein